MYEIVRGFFRPFVTLLYRLKVTGLEHIADQGSGVLAANHQSALDPIFLAVCIDRKIHFLGKEELFRSRISNWFFRKMGVFPVKRDNNDIAVLRSSLKALKQGELLGIFPQGTRVEKTEQRKAKTGVALLAVKGNSVVIPITVDADYKLLGNNRICIHSPYRPKEGQTYEEISEEVMKIIQEGEQS